MPVNPPPLVQYPIVKDHHSTLKVYRSYKEALGTLQKSKEIFFSCEECSYPFKSKEELGVHTMRHNQIHCTKCNTDFKTKLDLNFHINIRATVKDSGTAMIVVIREIVQVYWKPILVKSVLNHKKFHSHAQCAIKFLIQNGN